MQDNKIMELAEVGVGYDNGQIFLKLISDNQQENIYSIPSNSLKSLIMALLQAGYKLENEYGLELGFNPNEGDKDNE